MVYKLLAVGVIVLFLGMSVISSVAIDNEKKYLPISDGNTLYVGGTGEGNYTKIQDAIDKASDGDTVFVFDESSPYYENVLVDKRINLIGENRNTTVIYGMDVLYSTVSIALDADNALVSGFTITNSTRGIGIAANNNFVENNKIIFNYYGIKIYQDIRNNIITDNLILHNSHVGIYDECRDSTNTVKWNVIGSNGREAADPSPVKGGIFKHRCGGYFHHNDFDLNWGSNVHTDMSSWGIWDDGSEGNYWDDWNSNPGYPDTYIIPAYPENQIDHYPNATPYFNHPIVCTESSYNAEPGEPIDFWVDVNKPSSSVSWFWEFGDGNTSNKKSPEHAYNKSGIYQINVTITDNKGVSDTDRSTAYIGLPPDTPAIDGPTKGIPYQYYEYSIVANDSDSDYLHYHIYWGNGYDYIGPYPSGEVVKVGHAWRDEGNYTIRVQAIDETLKESEWGTFDVIIPRGRMSVNSLFLWFLERFPLLERLLGLILDTL